MRDALRFLARYIRPYRRPLVRAAVLAVLAAVLDALIPIVYGRAFDAVVSRAPFMALAVLLATWLAMRLVMDTLRRAVERRGTAIGYRAGMAFRDDAIRHLLALPLAYHHAHQRGDVGDRVFRAWGEFTGILRSGIFDVLPGMLTIILATIYLATVDLVLGIVNIVVVAAFIVWSMRQIPAMDVAWERRTKAERVQSARFWDAVQHVSVVKACNRESSERSQQATLGDRATTLHAAQERVHYRWRAGQDVCFGVGTVALVGIAAWRASIGVVTPGVLATVLGYAFLAWATTGMFLWAWWSLTSLGSYARAWEDVARQSEERYGVGRAVALRGGVAFTHVRFRYREDTPVLEDVSFTVQPNETVAVIGESGEGKTTIMELLGRFYDPQGGTITFDGIPATDIELGSLRAQIAYVPQDLALFHGTIADNIRYGKPDASDAAIADATRSAALHDWIASLPEQYTTVVGERGLKLSAGQRQRIAIARAFLRNPRILILDEPTSQLDAATEDAVQTSLHALMARCTTIVIAHRLRTVRDADHIFVLKNGRIAEEGTHAQLLRAKGEYATLHALQFPEQPTDDAEHGA